MDGPYFIVMCHFIIIIFYPIFFEYFLKYHNITYYKKQNINNIMSYNIIIYKLWLRESPDIFYVGSTGRGLSVRMSAHKTNAKNGRNTKLYRKIREKGMDAFEYAPLRKKLVKSKNEKLELEQKYIDALKPTLNTSRAHYTGTKKQYHMEYDKVRYVKIRKMRECVCGSLYNNGNTSDRHRHFTTDKHNKFINTFYNGLYEQLQSK